MHPEYNPSDVEAKWQKKWADAHEFEFDIKKAKNPYYLMVMFPYPSGAQLHVGHWFQYSIPDSFGRFQRMRGKDVFHPMGFDAFGLPAENYAIKTGTPPAKSTQENVDAMIEQFKRMGVMFDWKYSLNTSTPEYYRWTQWLFLQMHKHDLAYRKEGNVNWCPKDQTVLANEQVKDGCCERCGTEVIQKPLTQWYWKITDYAQRLLDGLENLVWPEKTKLMQQHWIGRSEGAEIIFEIANDEKRAPWAEDEAPSKITVFTTRPDTLFGVTYVVLAPEHPLVEKITPEKHRGAVNAYKEEVKKKTEMQRTALEKDKTGVATGAYAIHPVTGEKLPIWIADYVLMNYGTGAVMAVPAHDERDFAFAKEYSLPVIQVVDGGDITESAFTSEGIATNSEFLDGLPTKEAKKKMIAWLEDAEKGRGIINYRLRDWLVSRQRYWGSPIPIVYDPEGNPHPIPEKHLPWMLPTDVEFKPTGKSPLTESKEFIERTEKIFGKGWTPEFDTMDTFVCSSFYYLRYLASGDDKHLIDPTIEKKWMPVDMYIGGPEHATMHLIYARFVMMALKDFGFVSHEEPFQRLVHQGLITNQGAKMSKSKGNVVSPDSFVEEYGSDVFRMYLMFMGPFTDGGDWSDTGIKGIARFVQRVWRLISEKSDAKVSDSRDVLMKLHRTIKSVTDGLETLHFNTAIASLMELLNTLESQEKISLETAQTFAKLLSPIAPHLAEELWSTLGGKGFVIDQSWPQFDHAQLQSDTLTIVVQVNGKLRGDITVDAKAKKEDIIAEAKKDPNVAKYIESGIKKEIYVPEKLVSFVV
ncbi:MAG TPA: leucine--tRNA ligase [Candidatus Peribacteraceae bacterium]|nr:leucine--tRNA ligase [Candidatus Peribacteraceae bacterium]